MKKNLFLTFLLSLILASCKNEKKLFTLKANLTNIADSTFFYLRGSDTNTILDSAYVVNGSLSLKGQLNQNRPERVTIYSENPEFIYIVLLVENEHVTFNADKKDFPWNINVSGSIHQDEAEKFNKITYQKQYLKKELKQVYGSDKKLLSKKLTQLIDSLDNITIELIKENVNSYAALESFRNNKLKFSNEELVRLYNMLDPKLKETLFGKAVKVQSEYYKPKVGDNYYDYSAMNKNGESLALSDIKDKYILLHFSSIGCPYNKASMPELKELYNTYNDRLEIVSISSDSNKEQWQNHIKRDSITWPYLWNGKGDYDDAHVKYWIKGTPNYVLISPDKIILERWFGYRNGLIGEKLNSYFD
jgi:peroxiredoxin